MFVTFQYNMLTTTHKDTENTSAVHADTFYRQTFIMQAGKRSMTACNGDAKATRAMDPHCNLTWNGSSDRMSFLPIE